MLKSELQARAERVRKICRTRGITQSQIASDLGASQSQVSRILKGLRASRLAEEVCLYVEKFEGGVTAESVKENADLVPSTQTLWRANSLYGSWV